MYTMVLSITHRITGVFLSLGAILFVYWLVALSLTPDRYAAAQRLLGSGLAKLVWAGLIFSFCYHLANGLRHLAWDLGWGLEKRQARASGWVVVVVALLLTAVVIGAAVRLVGNAP
jgi:succinate dehydrogenase / fumarate reductase, cytochrome b subunit